MSTQKPFSLGVDTLSPSILVSLARQANPSLELSDQALTKVRGYRQKVEEMARSDKTVYGINTGFGFLSDVTISKDKLGLLQENLIRSHACGVGEAMSGEVVRGLLILRAHTFSLGHSGVSEGIIRLILDFLKFDILPFVPSKGSVGASGDLAPLSHLALSLIGEGEVFVNGVRQDSKAAFERFKLSPVKLGPKEGLSLINGTHFMSVIGAFAVEEAKRVALAADLATAMSLDAIRGSLSPFDERIHQIRPQVGQQRVAANLRYILSGKDEIMASHKNCTRVQDPYSFRCVPQVHGATRDAIAYVDQVVQIELNSVTDNPLAFDNGDVISGGNFHGQPIAIAMDFLGIAAAELGSISERRIEKLTNPVMSQLPAFLAEDSGLESGFMIPHVVAAALVSENKVLTHPASVDSIPTSADKEDHVSMGPIAARKAREILGNVANVLSIEFLAACRGLDLLWPLKGTEHVQRLRKVVAQGSLPIKSDRVIYKDIEKLSQDILSGLFLSNVEQEGLPLAQLN